MPFPRRIYTEREVQLAKSMIDSGYRHNLSVTGSMAFKDKVARTLELIKSADYYDFLTTYIRLIREVKGLSQLREEEASIWANSYLVEDTVDAASFFVQKASQMRDYLEKKIYYGHEGEKLAVGSRIEFLKSLSERNPDLEVKKKSQKQLMMWRESKFL